MKQLNLFELENYQQRSLRGQCSCTRSQRDWELDTSKPEPLLPAPIPPPLPPPFNEKKVFCNKTPDPNKAVTEYAPKGNAGGKHRYFRFSYRDGNKVKHVHIPGGNTTSPVAQRRAKMIRSFISLGKPGKWIESRIKIWR